MSDATPAIPKSDDATPAIPKSDAKPAIPIDVPNKDNWRKKQGLKVFGGDGESTEPRIGRDEVGEYRIDDKVWTMNEIRDHPMFMNFINPGLDIDSNPELLALQSLTYGEDQTPEEVAQHFRELGNEAFRQSTNEVATQNALLAYTRGIEWLRENESKDNVLTASLLSNRAAVGIRVEEYDKSINDCLLAIKSDPTNVKAYFRGAKASEALGLTARAINFCRDGLLISPGEKQMKQLQKSLEKTLVEEEAAREKDRLEANKAAQARGFGDVEAAQMLGERGVELGPQLYDMAMYARGEPWKPRLTEDGLAVTWAVLFLYDETSQSDFVTIFDERCALEEQLEMMFPAGRPVDWDEDGKYVLDMLDAFLEFYPEGASETALMQVPTDTPLQDVLHDRILPPCLAVHVLVRGSPAHAHFCKDWELTCT